MRPDYTKQNDEIRVLENVADMASRICIGFAIGFVFVAAAFWS